MQQTNCHPFRHEHWLFMHNGYINEFATIKRDLVLAIDPSLYPRDQGPGRHRGAVLPRAHLRARRTIRRPPSSRRSGSSKRSRSRHGVPHPFQGTIATTDGESIWAFRYSSEDKSRTLFYTTDVPTLRELYPDRQLLKRSQTTPG